MRFLRLEDVAEELNVKLPQVRALVKSGELKAIQIGGRGMWRVEREALEEYIQQRYAQAREDLAQGSDLD
ncbi:helix-turn-helix domain-containing protein [Glutamicibacter uratoxydans]|uniref:helix-turn-helix domain-containing protein n=1 Tax=Glutamicibacter uratoxydans TaxID=43667 RepID=UPI001144EEFD|nr:helix-turn-helix domain-containing protein [Glutamicibacter uratoxydans]